MIKAEGVSKYFRNPDGSVLKALDNVSLEIMDGESLVIAGANGSGKSLFMRILSGLEETSRGRLEKDSSIGLVFQDADSQILADTPLEDVLFGLRNRKDLSKTQKRELAMKALSDVGLDGKEESPAHLLSGGEKRRLAIASVLALGRDTIIFDEPYSNLDYPGIKSVNAIIRELQSKGMTTIVLTHEIEKCLTLCRRFVAIFKGRLVFDGTTDDALREKLEDWGIRNPREGGW